MPCTHQALCYYFGPHLGVISDNKLLKMYPPPLVDGELLLGVKAYADRALQHQVIAPIKQSKHESLLDAQLEYNAQYGWYQASIEHAFGYTKRFNIIGNRSSVSTQLNACERTCS